MTSFAVGALANARKMAIPASCEPVNAMPAMADCDTSERPVSSAPAMRLTAPFGNPAPSIAWTSSCALNAQPAEGLNTTVLPVVSAPAIMLTDSARDS